jgi:adenylate kinase family enzyme
MPMKCRRIHLMGASGSGVTTIGRALAGRLALPHHDSDDYFWLPTVPPYRTTRPVADRLRLMREMFLPRLDWVLSGSVTGWCEELVSYFDLVVFVTAPREIRMKRLRAREAAHFGADAVAPGGWRHGETEDFVEWASHYEAGDREGRSLAKHEAWLSGLPCPVVRVDGSRPLAGLVEQLCSKRSGCPADVIVSPARR